MSIESVCWSRLVLLSEYIANTMYQTGKAISVIDPEDPKITWSYQKGIGGLCTYFYWNIVRNSVVCFKLSDCSKWATCVPGSVPTSPLVHRGLLILSWKFKLCCATRGFISGMQVENICELYPVNHPKWIVCLLV
jgi:hypothetical protein